MKLLEPFAFTCITASALLCIPAVQAQNGAVDVDLPIIPEQAYPGDRIAVPLLGGGVCNAGHPDPAHPPTIRMAEHHVTPYGQHSYRYEVRYALLDTPDILCGVPPGPPILHADIGQLPIGYHAFDISGTVEGEEYVSYSTTSVLVGEHDRPADDISGIWYAPEQSGRGFTVVRSGSTFVLYWATHDGAGEPTWATLITSEDQDHDHNQNTFAGEAVATAGAPLTPGAAVLAAERWARVKFTSRGCGRATFQWGALDPVSGEPSVPDPAIGEGSLELVQVLVPDSVEPCDAVAQSGGLVATWLEAKVEQ